MQYIFLVFVVGTILTSPKKNAHRIEGQIKTPLMVSDEDKINKDQIKITLTFSLTTTTTASGDGWAKS